MRKVIKYVMIDILRSRVLLGYTLGLLLISFSIFSLEDNASKGLLSLLNIILILVPLVSIVYSTIYMYNASEFTELLLAQPIRRRNLLFSLFAGLCLSLILAFIAGVALPVIFLEGSDTAWMMIIAGIVLTAIFVALAVLTSVLTRDKAKAIGITIMLWLFFSLIFDALLLLIVFQLSDYPLEKGIILFSSLNPVDLARMLILLKMDISALMGYTGAVFQQFFGTASGIIYITAVLMLWLIIPISTALVKFRKKDL